MFPTVRLGLVAVAVCLTFPGARPGLAAGIGRTITPASERAERERKRILLDPSLSPDEKVRRLATDGREGYQWWQVLGGIHARDRRKAEALALDKLRSPATSREAKLWIGRMAVKEWKSPELTKAFAEELVDLVAHGGAAEFCRERRDGMTAVAQYAYIASDFQGYEKVPFDAFRDRKVIPALISGLDAPDEVYPNDQGCIVLGKPGAPTGRNVARQQIPMALARLGATEAVPRLQSALVAHHDSYLRCNAAYALGRLATGEDRRRVERWLKRSPENLKLAGFAFGSGLVARGDSDGLAYLHLDDITHGRTDLPVLLYGVEQLLDALGELVDPRTEAIYADLLNRKPLVSILLMDGAHADLRAGSRGHQPSVARTLGDLTERRASGIAGRIAGGVARNKLAKLRPTLEDIARRTKSGKVRDAIRRGLAGHQDGG